MRFLLHRGPVEMEDPRPRYRVRRDIPPVLNCGEKLKPRQLSTSKLYFLSENFRNFQMQFAAKTSKLVFYFSFRNIPNYLLIVSNFQLTFPNFMTLPPDFCLPSHPVSLLFIKFCSLTAKDIRLSIRLTVPHPIYLVSVLICKI